MKTSDEQHVEPTFVNIAGYKFVTLDQLATRRRRLRAQCQQLGLKGTVLLAPEGINLFLAGTRAAVDAVLDALCSDPALNGLTVKESLSTYQPFSRLLVRLKREIIAFGIDQIDPRQRTSRRISPEQLQRWLDERRTVILLDVRNDYEIELGTFRNAVRLELNHFRHFPTAAERLPASIRTETVVTFCTGGIRCEKAAPFLEQAGFQDVYQLDGGILNYFERCGSRHYEGDCFVFDKRVAVGPDLRETPAALCFACQATLTLEDQQSPRYVIGRSCPHCFPSLPHPPSEEIFQFSADSAPLAGRSDTV